MRTLPKNMYQFNQELSTENISINGTNSNRKRNQATPSFVFIFFIIFASLLFVCLKFHAIEKLRPEMQIPVPPIHSSVWNLAMKSI